MKAFIAQRKLYKCFENSLAWLGSDFGWCLDQMRASPIYRHQWNSLKPWGVPYNSRIIQNTLHNSIYKPMYKNIQEIPRILQKAFDSSHAFHHSVEMCGHLQTSLEPSTLFPPMTQCRWLQESPKTSWALYEPMGRLI